MPFIKKIKEKFTGRDTESYFEDKLMKLEEIAIKQRKETVRAVSSEKLIKKRIKNLLTLKEELKKDADLSKKEGDVNGESDYLERCEIAEKTLLLEKENLFKAEEFAARLRQDLNFIENHIESIKAIKSEMDKEHHSRELQLLSEKAIEESSGLLKIFDEFVASISWKEQSGYLHNYKIIKTESNIEVLKKLLHIK